MLPPWNDASLSSPPVYTYVDPKKSQEILSLKVPLEDLTNLLSNQQALHLEGAILSRLVYKYDKKFRHDIGFKNLKKVNTALRRYLVINLLKDLEVFYDVLPSNPNDHYVPTKQMLQYILIRLQSFAMLMVRICICAKKSAIFYMDRIKRGESHWMSLLPFAILSRVWSLCQVLLNNISTCYSKMIKYLPKLEEKGAPFLKQKYTFPQSLEQWLDLPSLDEQGKFSWSKNKCIEVISRIPKEETDEGFDIMSYVHNLNKSNTADILHNENVEVSDSTYNNVKSEYLNISQLSVSAPNTAINSIATENDGGNQSKIGKSINSKHIIDVDNFAESYKNIKSKKHLLQNKDKSHSCLNNPNKGQSKTHSIENINNIEKLKSFIIKEDKLRTKDSGKSLTTHLSFMQWQSLKTLLLKLCKIDVKDKTKLKKFQTIWKEKCVDYLD